METDMKKQLFWEHTGTKQPSLLLHVGTLYCESEREIELCIASRIDNNTLNDMCSVGTCLDTL
jgi:hypothetical protein